MNHKIVMHQKVWYVIILSLLLFGSGPVASAGEVTSIGGIQAEPIYENVTPVYDGKSINAVEDGWDSLPIWRQIIITDVSACFEGTILHRPYLFAAPVLFVLLGLFCILRFTSTKKRERSPIPKKLLAYIKTHPGSTQKQLLAAMKTSRGSVCYHLDKLGNAKKLQKVYSGNVPRYYPATEQTFTEDPLEHALRQLVSRKKSGIFLRTLHEHPGITRKELAELLGVLPTTIHWYLHTHANECIVSMERDGHEFHYALTAEAKQIYERLTQGHFEDSESQANI
ncbi:MAG: hypothetical protein O0V67_08290 [Methanocorpusculum sp.]|nr:hypothetical protein [Methanocorpusculum sp.]